MSMLPKQGLHSKLNCACISSTAGTGQNQKLPASKSGTNLLFANFFQQYKAAKSWRAAYKKQPAAACARNDTLCSVALLERVPGTAEAQLTIATSPDKYDARQATKFISKAKDQGDCSTSVAFATVAGAEAAVASVAGVQGSSISLSELDLYYCSKPDDDVITPVDEDGPRKVLPEVTCQSGNWIGPSVRELQRRNLQTRYCMPYGGFDSASEACSSSLCSSIDAISSQGSFSSMSIKQIWKAQQQIRQHGGVVTRFDMFDDFKPFFAIPGNARSVYSPSNNTQPQQTHAVFVVGYNNVKKYWIVKSSFGSGWADNGFFKVCSLLVFPAVVY